MRRIWPHPGGASYRLGWLRQIGWAKLIFAFGLDHLDESRHASPCRGRTGVPRAAEEGPNGGSGPVLLKIAAQRPLNRTCPCRKLGTADRAPSLSATQIMFEALTSPATPLPGVQEWCTACSQGIEGREQIRRRLVARERNA